MKIFFYIVLIGLALFFEQFFGVYIKNALFHHLSFIVVASAVLLDPKPKFWPVIFFGLTVDASGGYLLGTFTSVYVLFVAIMRFWDKAWGDFREHPVSLAFFLSILSQLLPYFTYGIQIILVKSFSIPHILSRPRPDFGNLMEIFVDFLVIWALSGLYEKIFLYLENKKKTFFFG